MPIIATICCAAFATPRSSGSTVFATTVISDGAEPPSPMPERIRPAKTSATRPPLAANANRTMDTATMIVPAIAAGRSPMRAAR